MKKKQDKNMKFSLRRSDSCLVLLGVSMVFLGIMFAQAHFQRLSDTPSLRRVAVQVRDLRLTDLCLFTEARYTRHLSQTDLYSPFQDHPVSLEHFPAGSIAPPPAGIGEPHGKLD